MRLRFGPSVPEGWTVLTERSRFFLLSLLGGVAVLGGYAIGLESHAGQNHRLWGEISEETRGVYTGCIFPAALGLEGWLGQETDPLYKLIERGDLLHPWHARQLVNPWASDEQGDITGQGLAQ